MKDVYFLPKLSKKELLVLSVLDHHGVIVKNSMDPIFTKRQNFYSFMKALEKKGLISRESNMSRAIKLCNDSPRHQSVAFLGTAVSGSPIRVVVSSDERVEFSSMFNGDDRAALQVEGTAFLPLGIADGDFLIISRDSHTEPGNLVVVLDDRHHVAIYRIPEDGGAPVPAITGAFEAPKRQILGVLAGVVRQLEIMPTVDPESNGTPLDRDPV